MKLRYVRPGREIDSDLGFATRRLIILCQALADLDRRHAHHGILGRIVIRLTAENLDSKCTLFERFSIPFQSTFHGVAEQVRESLAVAKKGARQDTPELLANGLAFSVGLRYPRRRLSPRSIDQLGS
jgi:hypothetical protein